MSAMHPWCRLIFFLSAMVLTISFMHPIVSVFSWFGACAWLTEQKGFKQALKSALGLLPLGMIAAIVNPLFNHHGVTILFYLPWGNPVTAEAVVYGACAALMIMALLLWSMCFMNCFGSDSLNAVMGRKFPRLSLLFSLIFGFIPRLLSDFHRINEAKKGIGEGIQGEKVIDKLHYGAIVFSSVLDRELDRSFDYAAALNASGYALQPRSRYAVYRFSLRDIAFLSALIAGIMLMITDIAILRPQFFPILTAGTPSLISLLGCLTVCFLPVLCRIYEVIKWKYLNAAI